MISMRMQAKVVGVFCTAVLVAGGAASAADVVAYQDDGVNDRNINFSSKKQEVGDQIVLAPGTSGHTVVMFEIPYYLTGTPGSAATAQVRFYANDGALFNGIPNSAMPSTPLYDSTPFSVLLTPRGTITFSQADFGTGFTLPETFTWSIQFNWTSGITDAGVPLYAVPQVGGNYNDYWYLDTDNNWQLNFSGGACPINFGAYLTVDLPDTGSSVMLFGSALMGLGWMTRRKI